LDLGGLKVLPRVLEAAEIDITVVAAGMGGT